MMTTVTLAEAKADSMSSTVELQIHVPTGLLQYGLDQAEIEQRVADWLVLSLFTEGRISSGKAARLLNISRVAFLSTYFGASFNKSEI